MVDLGVRLQLLVGATVPLPAPYEVVDALIDVEVQNSDRERDTFQLSFAVGKDSLIDYALLRQGSLDPPARVSVVVFISGTSSVLINGVVTDHQLMPSDRPGESTLYVTGEDLSFDMDVHDRSATFPNQRDSDIVSGIVAGYGLVPDVTSTSETPSQEQRIPTQQGTDLAFVRELARRNGFVFFVEPTAVPGASTAYWGPERRSGPGQPPLTVSMGPDSNVDRPINFNFNALGPVAPQVTILEPLTGLTIEIPIPTGLLPALTSRPAAALRTQKARDAANLDPVQAALRAVAASSQSSDAITAQGELDAVRYGRALRSRRLVAVHGAGGSYDGDYYVQQVTHRIRRGAYSQSFTLTREGLGASSQRAVS
jgi:hypothetical protein